MCCGAGEGAMHEKGSKEKEALDGGENTPERHYSENTVSSVSVHCREGNSVSLCVIVRVSRSPSITRKGSDSSGQLKTTLKRHKEEKK